MQVTELTRRLNEISNRYGIFNISLWRINRVWIIKVIVSEFLWSCFDFRMPVYEKLFIIYLAFQLLQNVSKTVFISLWKSCCCVKVKQVLEINVPTMKKKFQEFIWKSTENSNLLTLSLKRKKSFFSTCQVKKKTPHTRYFPTDLFWDARHINNCTVCSQFVTTVFWGASDCWNRVKFFTSAPPLCCILMIITHRWGTLFPV